MFCLTHYSNSLTLLKGTPIDPFPSLEPDEIGKYDDTVLERLDEFMLDAHSHGIKVLNIHGIFSNECLLNVPSFLATNRYPLFQCRRVRGRSVRKEMEHKDILYERCSSESLRCSYPACARPQT